MQRRKKKQFTASRRAGKWLAEVFQTSPDGSGQPVRWVGFSGIVMC